MHQNEASEVNPEPVVGFDTTVLRMSGKVNYATVKPLTERISDVLDSGCIRVVLDMSDVESLSGGALGALLLQQTDAEQLGGSIKIAAASSKVYQTLKANGFTAVFDIFDTAREAVRSFKARTRVA